MKTLPHRAPVRDTTHRDEARRSANWDLLAVAALFWMVSVVRVVGAFVRHETFGAEATLALMGVIGIPWVALLREGK